MPSNVYNANWLANNLVRKYPLDSLASCIDDEGNYFPDEVITDIQIAYPTDLGEYCYIASAKLTENIISILIAVDNTPIAALCASIDDIFSRTGLYHNLTSLYNGVQGIIAVGVDRSSKPGSWEFTNKLASRILPTCCTPYVRPKVLSLSRPSDETPLEGNILLTSGGDIKLSVEPITVDGVTSKAIFVGLDLSVDPHTVLRKYITSCEVSTSMNSCAMPYLESIGGAIPDCSGNVNIVAGDSGHMNITTQDGKVYISTDIELKDVCGDKDDNSDSESSSESETQCPYPSVISDDICPNKSRINPVIYDFTGTDVDLYSNDVRLSKNSRAGLLYGNNPDKPNSITTADPLSLADFDVKIKPNTQVAIQLSFDNQIGGGFPDGHAIINIGNDKVFIDQGQIAVLCDDGQGDDRKGFGRDMMFGVSEAKIVISDTSMDLVTSKGTTHLADLDDGLVGSSDDYKLHVQLGDKVYLDGVRYD